MKNEFRADERSITRFIESVSMEYKSWNEVESLHTLAAVHIAGDWIA